MANCHAACQQQATEETCCPAEAGPSWLQGDLERQWCSIICVSFSPANSKYIHISDCYKVVLQRQKKKDSHVPGRKALVASHESPLWEGTASFGSGTGSLLCHSWKECRSSSLIFY